ncbi:MAG: linear amide C-N hydrolase, partial [Finegoldia magna]|nr:linear amide C-N hydrolase [Finegoldia magna]
MCTTIIVDYPQGSVMARTLDFEVPLEYNMIYIPRGFHYADDLYHKPLHSKYKMMGMCFRNLYPIKDGVNEHGLCGCTNMF